MYYNPICKYLLLFTNDFSVIEDVVQSIFVKLWEERGQYEIDSIRAYLFVASRNKVLNEIRNQNTREQLLAKFYLDELILDKSEDIIDNEEFKFVVNKVVNELSDRAQVVYRLSREEGLSYKEIAVRLDISVNTVENHMGHALRRITDILRELYKTN